MVITKTQMRVCASALLAAGAMIGTSAALAAGGNLSDARARYEQERAACNAGQTAEDRATCMREAGAALQENSRGHLVDADQAQLRKNALIRCEALPVGDRPACHARIQGQGIVSGSVAGGGMLREYIEEVPAAQGDNPAQ